MRNDDLMLDDEIWTTWLALSDPEHAVEREDLEQEIEEYARN